MDDAARNIIEGLLQQDPRDRLGVDEIKAHHFLADIDFQTLLRQVRILRLFFDGFPLLFGFRSWDILSYLGYFVLYHLKNK